MRLICLHQNLFGGLTYVLSTTFNFLPQQTVYHLTYPNGFYVGGALFKEINIHSSECLMWLTF